MPEFCNYPKYVKINCEHFFKWLNGQSLKKNINSHFKDKFYVFIMGYILIPKACPYFLKLECLIQGIKSWDSSPPVEQRVSLRWLSVTRIIPFTCWSLESIQKGSTMRIIISIYREQNWGSETLGYLLQFTSTNRGFCNPCFRSWRVQCCFLQSVPLKIIHGTQRRTPVQALHCIVSKCIRIPLGLRTSCFPEQ